MEPNSLSEERKYTYNIVLSMTIWGTIGLFVRFIPLPAGFIALGRGVIGSVALIAYLKFAKIKFDVEGFKCNKTILILSGFMLGLNWSFLFLSYQYTTVAVSTLCYFMAPVFVIVTSPFLFKEKLTLFDISCTVIAVLGMILITLSDSGRDNFSPLGIIYGLIAALGFYLVVVLNRFIKPVSNLTKTIVQLLSADFIMVLFCLFTGSFNGLQSDAKGWIVLFIVGLLHTSFTYYLYFGALDKIKASKTALVSYINPAISTICSIYILKEDFNVFTVLGAVLILGSSLIHSLKKDN